ncbi:MAG: acetyl-CoA carboxylase, carboxyltransferase subunit beta [Candidatus Dormiibacterota bacterium]
MGRVSVPPRVARPCPACGDCHGDQAILDLDGVCPGCGHHYRIGWRRRIDLLLDADSFEEWDRELRPRDPLGFVDLVPYSDRLAQAHDATGLHDAIVSGSGRIEGMAVGIAVMEFGFVGGSMGEVVGERIARAMERSAARGTPFVAITASGGARMQEGLLSLMQMAKTSIARSRLADAPVPYITILTDPTMGGVMASFAASADAILAEPGATVGFAGARVISQATHEEIPDGFQTSEFMLHHGFVDRVVPRRDLRVTLSRLLRLYPTVSIEAVRRQA